MSRAASDASDASASYAAEVTRLLWPAPWGEPQLTRGRHRGALEHRDAYVFPSARKPRLLVPADVPDSFTMLKRLGNDRSRFAGPLRTAVQWSVRSPLFGLARWPVLRVSATTRGAESIEDHLAGCLDREVRVGVVLGPRRVNQKPVLQIFGLDGTLLGFAKLGHNALTAELVRREAASLASVGAGLPRTFRAPHVIHHGQWSGLEVLVMSALTSDPRLPVPPATRLAAMREVIGLTADDGAPLAGSVLGTRLRHQVAALGDTPWGGRLDQALAAIDRDHGDQSVRLGGWHGDWGTWNMGMGDGALQLWDWERYDPAVPVGFDGLHLAAQRVRPGQSEQAEQARQEAHFLSEVPRILDDLGGDPDQHDLTLRLYLLEIGLRYADALQHGATPALQERISWVLGLLERLLDHPHHSVLSEGRP